MKTIGIGGAISLVSGCTSTFRTSQKRNMEPFPSSISLDYSQHKKHVDVVNGRAYTKEEIKPAKTLEEVVQIPPGKIYRVPALKADYIINGDEIFLRYRSRVPAEDLQKRFSDVEFLKPFKISAYSNRLFFSGKKEAFEDFTRFRDLINFLDIPGEQIRVAVSIIEHFQDNTYDREWNMNMLKEGVRVFTLNLPSSPDVTKTLNTGIDVNPFFNYDSHTYNVVGALKFLDSYGKARVATSVDVIAPNGGTSTLSSMAMVPYPNLLESKTGWVNTYKYQDTGTSVTVVPSANDEGSISVKFTIQTGEQTGFAAKYQVPVFKKSTYDTTVDLRNGQTEIFGVSISDRYSGVDRKTPIPILKNLFSSKEFEKSKSELIYIVTARVVGREDYIPFDVKDGSIITDGFSHELYNGASQPKDSQRKPSGIKLLLE